MCEDTLDSRHPTHASPLCGRYPTTRVAHTARQCYAQQLQTPRGAYAARRRTKFMQVGQ